MMQEVKCFLKPPSRKSGEGMGLILLFLFLSLSGCRGWTTSEPPVHPNQNMDTQIKYKPYRESEFFSDKRDMRPRVPGTIARGDLKDQAKPPITHKLMRRGQERYNIYCSPCHSAVGDGDGLVGRQMPIKPTTFHSDYLRSKPLSYFVEVMTDGVRTMPSYQHQISFQDRWAIAAYVRALQELDTQKSEK